MICPRCQLTELEDERAGNALSRLDNDTYVCSPCGTDEAMLDVAGIGQRETWPIKRALMDWEMLTNLAKSVAQSGSVDG
jgi:hypothetical protein